MIEDIRRTVIWRGRKGGPTWFHPRAAVIPSTGGGTPQAIMTLQQITGSDIFGAVHETCSDSLGERWDSPLPIPGMGRTDMGGGLERGVCDVVPGYHAETDTVLAIGHDVYYRDGKLARPDDQFLGPVYAVKDLDDGSWLSPRRMPPPDTRMAGICSSGCSQRLHLAGGKILLPISWAQNRTAPRTVGTLLLSHDGNELVNETSTRRGLRLDLGRGLLEPSLTSYDGTYYMTIRAEDGRGYLSTSEDGLEWSELAPWAWDDGDELEMSTTQQHWLRHSEGLHLVYTRKTGRNLNVFRWRSPLLVSRFDTDEMCLVRESERVVFPLIGDGVGDPEHVARMGNFHCVSATADESWVTVGETLPAGEWRGNTMMARIIWKDPNRLAPGF
jgi:hypothetical protein